jgi:hypothetical protein
MGWDKRCTLDGEGCGSRRPGADRREGKGKTVREGSCARPGKAEKMGWGYSQ